MKNKTHKLVCLILFGMFLASCANNKSNLIKINDSSQVLNVMQKHLDAVTNKDLATLATTLSPSGEMQLILPETEIMESVDSFLKFHEPWFKDKSWTFETKILNSEVGVKLAMVVVQIIYREPDRNGKPYYNRMIVSYVLEKTNGNWYVIKDHASSIEKSTDKTS